ncbi:transcriptional regulator [Amycolatopsis antarctica]|uniref:Transcriptional regulator n=1 Tax=Amycolatopsis antarctica TaxID=1854586 RepID=A0A263D2U1_9PSEU|nr:helix-turn-helix domain-containing protein [Amycolatopsis antarctica]OZM72794.1 transcriptional regulator [Amycolatopsis antarctica]
MNEQVDGLAREIFAHVGGRWGLLIVYALDTGTLRFSELHAGIDGISHKMLTQTLRGLERDGLVTRTVYPTVPPKVEYSLTAAGKALRANVDGMCEWTRRHLDAITAARHRFDTAEPGPPGGVAG